MEDLPIPNPNYSTNQMLLLNDFFPEYEDNESALFTKTFIKSSSIRKGLEGLSCGGYHIQNQWLKGGGHIGDRQGLQ